MSILKAYKSVYSAYIKFSLKVKNVNFFFSGFPSTFYHGHKTGVLSTPHTLHRYLLINIFHLFFFFLLNHLGDSACGTPKYPAYIT